MQVKERRAKKAVRIERDRPIHWVGDGFAVRTLLSYSAPPEEVSPFLLLDYAAPREFAPSDHRRGVGVHPHRGFETVTIAYQGEVEHRDSSGASGRIGPGDVQWMTAASGVLHEERHGADFSRTGGTFEMVQLWVNLPARLKMAPPAYQELRAQEIPTVELPDGAGTARVIAGELLGVRGPARTSTPVGVVDLHLSGGRTVALDVPAGHVAVLLVRRGALRVDGSDTVGPAELALLGRQGDALELDVTEDSEALLLTGEPLAEPVAGQGPFVMNTDEELAQAFADLRAGTFLRT